jgi:hypothetical protein
MKWSGAWIAKDKSGCDFVLPCDSPNLSNDDLMPAYYRSTLQTQSSFPERENKLPELSICS